MTIADAPIPFERERDNQAWARWLGRLLDRSMLLPFVFAVFLGLGGLVEFGRLPPEFVAFVNDPLQAAIAEIVVALVLWMLWEPLFLSNTGTTPGKWIMGVSVRRPDGSKLGLFTAFRRFVWVYFAGLGLGIPLVSLITMLISRAKLVGDGVTGWDSGLGVEVTHVKRHPIVWTLAFILVIGINIGLGILSRLGNQ